MRALLVTSQVTYVPLNYRGLFDELMSHAGEHVAGLVILRNFSFKLLAKSCAIQAIGCPAIGRTMLSNIFKLPLRWREKIFEKKNLPVIYAESMNEQRVIEWVRQNQIDIVVNLRTRCIYKKEILSAPRIGCINIHHGILPEYRGTFCDLYALSENRPAGFTIHAMNEKIDAGNILVKKTVSITGEKNYIKYLARSAVVEATTLSNLLNETAAAGRLPEGMPNICVKPFYSKNPNLKQIRQLKSMGMIL
ncbi:MAG: formyltransferase family protein [Bdellovibrionota bacterium]